MRPRRPANVAGHGAEAATWLEADAAIPREADILIDQEGPRRVVLEARVADRDFSLPIDGYGGSEGRCIAGPVTDSDRRGPGRSAVTGIRQRRLVNTGPAGVGPHEIDIAVGPVDRHRRQDRTIANKRHALLVQGLDEARCRERGAAVGAPRQENRPARQSRKCPGPHDVHRAVGRHTRNRANVVSRRAQHRRRQVARTAIGRARHHEVLRGNAAALGDVDIPGHVDVAELRAARMRIDLDGLFVVEVELAVEYRQRRPPGQPAVGRNADPDLVRRCRFVEIEAHAVDAIVGAERHPGIGGTFPRATEFLGDQRQAAFRPRQSAVHRCREVQRPRTAVTKPALLVHANDIELVERIDVQIRLRLRPGVGTGTGGQEVIVDAQRRLFPDLRRRHCRSTERNRQERLPGVEECPSPDGSPPDTAAGIV